MRLCHRSLRLYYWIFRLSANFWGNHSFEVKSLNFEAMHTICRISCWILRLCTSFWHYLKKLKVFTNLLPKTLTNTIKTNPKPKIFPQIHEKITVFISDSIQTCHAFTNSQFQSNSFCIINSFVRYSIDIWASAAIAACFRWYFWHFSHFSCFPICFCVVAIQTFDLENGEKFFSIFIVHFSLCLNREKNKSFFMLFVVWCIHDVHKIFFYAAYSMGWIYFVLWKQAKKIFIEKNFDGEKKSFTAMNFFILFFRVVKLNISWDGFYLN